LESFVAPDDIGIDCFHDVAEGVSLHHDSSD